ncbi:hypothetical protein NDU88_001621 [Pleurodeles waltl]|uniref:Uncharacterized protein n=1 Tax=Pleurodeles waltl TaxID=8319 RepID=A0AAV7T024_PLEWA|nr:hypothetical protein NDU88_001621 [Pleurodeles waltl]
MGQGTGPTGPNRNSIFLATVERDLELHIPVTCTDLKGTKPKATHRKTLQGLVYGVPVLPKKCSASYATDPVSERLNTEKRSASPHSADTVRADWHTATQQPGRSADARDHRHMKRAPMQIPSALALPHQQHHKQQEFTRCCRLFPVPGSSLCQRVASLRAGEEVEFDDA